jgi:hypothetical protein
MVHIVTARLESDKRQILVNNPTPTEVDNAGTYLTDVIHEAIKNQSQSKQGRSYLCKQHQRHAC